MGGEEGKLRDVDSGLHSCRGTILVRSGSVVYSVNPLPLARRVGSVMSVCPYCDSAVRYDLEGFL